MFARRGTRLRASDFWDSNAAKEASFKHGAIVPDRPRSVVPCRIGSTTFLRPVVGCSSHVARCFYGPFLMGCDSLSVLIAPASPTRACPIFTPTLPRILQILIFFVRPLQLVIQFRLHRTDSFFQPAFIL